MSDLLMKPPVPCFRIFDEAKAVAFYLGYLGFAKDWEHRHEVNLPLYLQVSRSGCVLHLSEHHGDGCPGAFVIVGMEDVEALHRELHAKAYPNMNPGLVDTPWGTRDLAVIDPFGNRICFSMPQPAPAS